MNKHVFLVLCAVVCCVFPSIANFHATGKLLFTENKGQITNQLKQPRPDIQFKLESPDLTLFISNTGLHYQWNRVENGGQPITTGVHDITYVPISSYRMDVTLIDANPNAIAVKEQESDEVERYYTTTTAAAGSVVHKYGKITYENVYPDIDWVLYIETGTTGQPRLKYDFVIRPGGNVQDIKLHFGGASQLAIDENGSLQATTPMGHITEKAPYSYATTSVVSGERREIASSFVLNKDVLTFATAAHQGTLVIDPELEWATYYGGGYWDIGACTLVDDIGNVYMTGVATSTSNIATDGAFQTTWAYGGLFAPDGFIAKFDDQGTRIWATYYGGNGGDYAYGAAMDVAGNIYLSGYTSSTDVIATPESYQPTPGGMDDVFLVKFDTSGQRIWGTYYGSTKADKGGFIATDDACNIYLTGHTKSTTGIATSGSFQELLNGTSEDAFLVKFDSSGQPLWATYYGSSGQEISSGVACDQSGGVYINGSTKSASGIATSGSHQDAFAGGVRDLYLARFDAAGNREWATYYGGPGDETAASVAALRVDAAGNIYMGGSTVSEVGIATTGSHQESITPNPEGANLQDAFLVKFNPLGERQWGTYYGGAGQEIAAAMTIDVQGNIFWTGLTKSESNIATAGSIQQEFSGGTEADAFIVKLDGNGQRIWGSYLGGNSADEGYGVAVDLTGNVYLTGTTSSDNFPISENSHQDTIFAMISNAFLAKLCGAVLEAQTLIEGSDSLCHDNEGVYAITPIDGASYIWTMPDGWSGTSDSSSILVHTGDVGGNISVQIVKCNDTSNIISREVGVFPFLEAIITVDGFILSTLHTHESYQWLLNGEPIPGATGDTYSVQENGVYSVVTMNNHDCADTSDIYTVTNYTGINDPHMLASQVSIYPNPAQNKLYINSPVPLVITLTSIEGRILIDGEVMREVSLEGLAGGIYLLRIADKDGHLVTTEKVIKQ